MRFRQCNFTYHRGGLTLLISLGHGRVVMNGVGEVTATDCCCTARHVVSLMFELIGDVGKCLLAQGRLPSAVAEQTN